MTSYDQVPYRGYPFAHAHVQRLATMARLHDIDSPPPESCRVLELGCGDGAHLLPMAVEFPASRFMGIDMSRRAIETALGIASALHLENVSFLAADVRNLDLSEPFDYVIAHGLYSWIPPEAQQTVMELCGRLVSPNGVVYISHNVYPGQRLRQIARDLMELHTEGIEDPAQRASAALEALRVAASARTDANFYTLALAAELKRLTSAGPQMVIHDALEPSYTPLYFREFAGHAAAHGLQFLSESDLSSMHDTALQAEAREFLAGVSDPILQEQYRDFFRGTSYRETLLCRKECEVDRSSVRTRMRALWLGSSLKRNEGGFVAENGAKIHVDHPFAQAALQVISERWPQRIRYEEVVRDAGRLAGAVEPELADRILTEMLFRMSRQGVLEYNWYPYRHAWQASEHPVASPLARLQAGLAEAAVTSLRHIPVKLDHPAARRLLSLLDGTRNLQQLRRELPGEDVGEHLRRLERLCLLVA